jgi:fumarylpyruvate hydrolase
MSFALGCSMLAFPAPPTITVPIEGGDQFPVRRVFCVGRNYAEHAREMGHDPNREPPFFFSKPADALVTGGADTPYPLKTADLHHEIELVVALKAGGTAITSEAALDLIFGYAAGIDLTRRDLQAEAKKAARPWDMAKGFDHSAPIGTIRRAGMETPIGRISLTVNDAVRQDGKVSDMIWPIPDIIAALSAFIELKPGDLIFTGTPAGVAAVVRGDRLQGEIEGVGTVDTTII